MGKGRERPRAIRRAAEADKMLEGLPAAALEIIRRRDAQIMGLRERHRQMARLITNHQQDAYALRQQLAALTDTVGGNMATLEEIRRSIEGHACDTCEGQGFIYQADVARAYDAHNPCDKDVGVTICFVTAERRTYHPPGFNERVGAVYGESYTCPSRPA